MNAVRSGQLSVAALATVMAMAMLAATAALAQARDPHADHHHGAGPSPADGMAGMDMGSMKGMDMDMGAGHPPAARALPDLPTSVSTADGVTLRTSATRIALAFDRPVIITGIALRNAAGQRLPIPATLDDGPVAALDATLIRLPPGTYTLAWRKMDGDVRGGGTRAFTVR